jgi:tetratricopeptide (TPR) repeat protein
LTTDSGFVLYGHRRYAAAESTLRRVTAIDSTFQFATVGLCAVLLERGQVEESIARLEKLVAVSGIRRWEKVPLLAYAYARAGRVPQAKETVAAFLRENSGQSPVSAALAAALDALGEHERAIVVLRTAVEQHDPWLTPFSRSAVFDRLRADPRAAALLAHVEAP